MNTGFDSKYLNTLYEDKAPVVIQKLDAAVTKLADFMQSQGLACTPEAVHSLNGDEARAAFIKNLKEVQRLKTQLDQYTDLTEDNAVAIEHLLPAENLQGFRDAYLETAQRLKQTYGAQQAQPDAGSTGAGAEVDQLEFEFVLFASAVIDYDYIIGLIQADAKFMNEREKIAAYINTLKAGEGLSEQVIRDGYTRFKKEKGSAQAETALIKELGPLLAKRAQGRAISGLSAYEH